MPQFIEFVSKIVRIVAIEIGGAGWILFQMNANIRQHNPFADRPGFFNRSAPPFEQRRVQGCNTLSHQRKDIVSRYHAEHDKLTFDPVLTDRSMKFLPVLRMTVILGVTGTYDVHQASHFFEQSQGLYNDKMVLMFPELIRQVEELFGYPILPHCFTGIKSVDFGGDRRNKLQHPPFLRIGGTEPPVILVGLMTA